MELSEEQVTQIRRALTTISNIINQEPRTHRAQNPQHPRPVHTVDTWIQTHLIPSPSNRVAARDLIQASRTNPRTFGAAATRAGLRRYKSNGTTWYLDVALAS